MTIAAKLFTEDSLTGNELDELLHDFLSKIGTSLDNFGWDEYDNSIEIYHAEPSFRLSVEAQRAVHDAGFSTVYVNHTDKWETHYNFKG
jgi:hypothetical protein